MMTVIVISRTCCYSTVLESSCFSQPPQLSWAYRVIPPSSPRHATSATEMHRMQLKCYLVISAPIATP